MFASNAWGKGFALKAFMKTKWKQRTWDFLLDGAFKDPFGCYTDWAQFPFYSANTQKPSFPQCRIKFLATIQCFVSALGLCYVRQSKNSIDFPQLSLYYSPLFPKLVGNYFSHSFLFNFPFFLLCLLKKLSSPHEFFSKKWNIYCNEFLNVESLWIWMFKNSNQLFSGISKKVVYRKTKKGLYVEKSLGRFLRWRSREKGPNGFFAKGPF